MQFHDHFSTLARRYADFRPHYPAELFAYVASVASARGVVWDCACGNGQASLGLADHFQRVIATDASEKQIVAAKAHPRIEYRVASAETSGLAEASVDAVTVAQALHWFNLDAFYTEAKRVLRPGGVLAFWSYGISKIDHGPADELFQDFYWNVVGPYWPPERKIVEEGYQTLPFPFKELQPPPITMKTRWTLPELIGYLSTWSGVKRYVEARGESPLPQFEAQMLLAWENPEIRREITWPLSMRAGVRE